MRIGSTSGAAHHPWRPAAGGARADIARADRVGEEFVGHGVGGRGLVHRGSMAQCPYVLLSRHPLAAAPSKRILALLAALFAQQRVAPGPHLCAGNELVFVASPGQGAFSVACQVRPAS